MHGVSSKGLDGCQVNEIIRKRFRSDPPKSFQHSDRNDGFPRIPPFILVGIEIEKDLSSYKRIFLIAVIMLVATLNESYRVLVATLNETRRHVIYVLHSLPAQPSRNRYLTFSMSHVTIYGHGLARGEVILKPCHGAVGFPSPLVVSPPWQYRRVNKPDIYGVVSIMW